MTNGTTVDIPPEFLNIDRNRRISFATYIERLRRANPLGLYLSQLTDFYYQQVVTGKMKEDEAVTEYEKNSKIAEDKAKFGFPISTMPLYDKVSKVYGNNLTVSYRDYIDALESEIGRLKRGVSTPEGRKELEMAVQSGKLSEKEAWADNPFYTEFTLGIQQAARKEKESLAKQKESLMSGVYSPEGRVRLQQEVAKGTLTSEEAYDQNPYWLDFTQREVAKGQEQTAQEAEQRRLRIAQLRRSPEGRQRLIDEGLMDQQGFFVPGSPEEKAVIDEAEQFGKGALRGTDAVQTLQRLIAEAKQKGIDTSQAESIFSQMAVGGGSDIPLATTSQGLAAQMAQQGRVQRSMQSQLLAKQYPDLYQNWQTEITKGYGGNPPQGYEEGFYPWATDIGTAETPLTPSQTAFQNALRQRTQQNLEQYGDIYRAYQGFTGKLTDPEQYKPFEQWLQETPEAKLAWEKRQEKRQPKKTAIWR